MSTNWPPSPLVEDEEVSLAREHGSDSSDTKPDHGKAPDGSKGAVDQYPIIQDVNAKDEPRGPQHTTQPGFKISASSLPSSEPEKVNCDRRYIFVPSSSVEYTLQPDGIPRQRSKSTTRIDGDETPRGRPYVSRIHTDLGGDELHSMATGQRRTPSPYAHWPSAPKISIPTPADKSKSFPLSPESAANPPSLDAAARRARSAHPERGTAAAESSDSNHNPSHRRHRSRSRVAPQSSIKENRSDGEDHRQSGRTERHRSRHRRSQQSPPADPKSDRNHRSAHGNITPPQTPRLPQESPYTSAAEDLNRPRKERSRHRERCYSKESPHPLTAEGQYKRWPGDEKSAGTRSRRGSMKRVNKPQIDLSDDRSTARIDANTPMSARTPKALEDYFQRALGGSPKKHSRYGSQNSAHPSPFSSPPTSPPPTPRGERKTRDYFELSSPISAPPKQRSRPPSIDESPIKPPTSLLNAATFGAASLAAKAVPNISRSSTASLETPSSGSQSSLASGQRSRKPSPVYEEQRTMSRAGSSASKEEIQGSRKSTHPTQNDCPVSRAGSVASREEGIPIRSSTYPLQNERPVSRSGSLNESYPGRTSIFTTYDERPSSRNSSYSPNLTAPAPPTQRSSSYSSPYDQSRPRPNSRRTYSSTNGAVVMPASSRHPHPASNLSRSYNSPVAVNNTSPLPTAVEAKEISFPLCPCPRPVTGSNHWYTIQGMENFDICSTCMQVFGGSAFRDYCIPSPYRAPTERVACSLSRPWIRLAIARCLKDGNANVSLLQNLNRLPPEIWPCPGKAIDVRKWYHVTDPTTKMPVSSFDVCTACVRSIELIFPELKQEKIFERPENKLSQERVCSLNSSSKHFYSILNELGRLANYSRKKDLRRKDMTNFVDFVRKKTKYRECARDAMLATPLWHFIPGLPELTICEECFEEVVWPLKDKPIAKDVLKTVQRVPTYQSGPHTLGVSCQLYSERMRAVFKEAVARNDFEGLKDEAVTRYNVEHRLQEKHRILSQELKAGFDRREDMERNGAVWKTYE